MVGRDITEGRAERAIAVDLGIVSSSSIWENTDIFYDTAVGGLPFFLTSDKQPRFAKNNSITAKNLVSNQSLVGG
jgi:hypothetical protein